MTWGPTRILSLPSPPDSCSPFLAKNIWKCPGQWVLPAVRHKSLEWYTHTHTHTPPTPHNLSSLFAAAMLWQLQAQHPGFSLAQLHNMKYQHHPGGQLKAGPSVELVLVRHSKFPIRQRKQMSSYAQLPLSVCPETKPRSSVIPSWLKVGSCNSLQDVHQFSSVQFSRSVVSDFATPWIAAHYGPFHFRVRHQEGDGYFSAGLDFSDATSNSESIFPFCHP